MPRVLNKYKDLIPSGAVYIGRPSKWGNPFKISPTCSREDSVRLFELYLLSNIKLMNSLIELQDKDLVCFCAPLICHGDVLIKYANKIYCPHCGHFDISFRSEFVQCVGGLWINKKTGNRLDPFIDSGFRESIESVTHDNPLVCNTCNCEFLLGEE